MTETTVLRMPGVMRRVNELIWESESGAEDEAVAFFCECSDEGCYQPVWLTGAAYERRRRDPFRSVLAEGHLAAPVVERPWALV